MTHSSLSTLKRMTDRLLEPDAVETPAAVVDLEQARRNARKVARYLADHGLAWRPHVKTHKSRTLAAIQLEEGAAGLTVATLREAEAMAPLGADLLLVHPPVGRARERRLAGFLERWALRVALDSTEALGTVERAARGAGRVAGVLVEFDVGMGRVGVGSPEDVVRLAHAASEADGLRFDGVLFYPGHIRTPGPRQDRALAAVGEKVEQVLEALDAAGAPPRTVSGGSTPTLWRSHEVAGLTEVRAGTCIFHDRDTVALRVCGREEVAYRILTTVISTAVADQAVVDAGSKALAREEFRAGGRGYGVVEGRPDVIVRSVSEEHGILDLAETSWRPRVGDRIAVIPNHVCVSVNLQDRLLAAEDGGYRSVALEGRGRLP